MDDDSVESMVATEVVADVAAGDVDRLLHGRRSAANCIRTVTRCPLVRYF